MDEHAHDVATAEDRGATAAGLNGGTREGASDFGRVGQAEAFARFLERHRGEHHLVALQDYPDPDAIAAALAYRALGAPYDISADIVYDGRISHQENLALVHLLELDLTQYTEALALDDYDGAVFVDNQGTTTNLTDRLSKAEIPTLAVIDHHTPQGVLNAEFTDIRPVGATATIFADYIQSGALVTLSRDREGDVALATALIHALRSETNGFIRAGTEEYAAGAFLSRYHDPQLVESILRVQRSRGTMEVIRMALTSRQIREGFSIAGVGYLRPADRDAIPQATDFLLTEETVATAIVYGIVIGQGAREVVVGSVRTSRLTLAVDQFLKAALGSDSQGRFYGGGRSRAGGFEIPVGFLEGTADAEQMRMKWDAFNQQIRAKLWHAAGLEEQAGEEE